MNNGYKILITAKVDGCPEVFEAFEGIGTVETLPGDPEIVAERIGEFDACLTALTVPFDQEMVSRAERLKVLGTPSTGTDHLDLGAIRDAGITCFDISKEMDLIRSFTATSELAFSLLLNVNRGVIPAAQAALSGDWARERFTGFQLSGKTLGILGLGRLGTISARIAQGFGMRVIANDVLDVSAPGVEMVDFETLLSEADVLTLHLHLRPETKGIIGRDALARMKSNAIIINTSRGALIDEAALLDALTEKRIAGAGLDLIDGEWLDDVSAHPLIRYANKNDNLVITPHIGGNTYESIYDARIFMARKIADHLRNLDE